jgi:hypothetical protein
MLTEIGHALNYFSDQTRHAFASPSRSEAVAVFG